jgi:hypothetical protein
MTTATRAVREKAFQPLECDIPSELTIAEYRDRRRPPVERRRPRRTRLSSLLRR